MVAASAVAIALMFSLHLCVCDSVPAFAALTALTIVFDSVAKLATVTNTISVEKDWVVVIADSKQDTLAGKWISLT